MYNDISKLFNDLTSINHYLCGVELKRFCRAEMRPQVICHMMSSVDGKLDTDRYTQPFDGKCFDQVSSVYFDVSSRFEAQAILIGRKAVQKHYFSKRFSSPRVTPVENFESYFGRQEPHRSTVIVDPSGKILYEDDNIEGENIIAVLGEGVSQEYLLHLREMRISYLFSGHDGRTIALRLESLPGEFGVERLLLVGGGGVVG